MRANLFLLLFSTTFSVMLGLYLARDMIWREGPEGSTFESIGELRQKITERDERDVKSDRSVSLRSIIVPNESDYVIYELAPNLDVKFQGVRVTTNSFGMRSPERPQAKPAGTYRIALLGDSYAFGWGVEQDKIFAAEIERILNEDSEVSQKIEVLNFGVPGYSTFQEVTQFFSKGAAFDPDLVLVFFIDNDFGLPFFIKKLGSPAILAPSAQFRKMREAQTDRVERKKTSDFLGSINANDHLRKLADALEQKRIPLVLSINPRRSSALDEKRLPILRHHANLHYHPIKEAYKAYITEKGLSREQLTLPSDPHPNARRHGIYGRLLAAELKPYILKSKEN
ncbi:MAG: SGNH/GDSL hydrolase family protein [Bdellovibrionales bacterium]|nr:SGNH/GDSL hydrolase family protein [Bdellovibrionales bacterium]